jgi:catechol 2,3-dioxygenase-like lactoylglutathione lyase family enzyme
MANPKVGLITLGVRDLAASRRFYSGLGFSERKGSEESVAFYETGGAWLAVWGRDALAEDAAVAGFGENPPAFSIAHNEPSKAAVDAFIQRAVAAGGRLVKAPHDTFWGGYSGYFADPDGFIWECAWNPFMPELAGT